MRLGSGSLRAPRRSPAAPGVPLMHLELAILRTDRPLFVRPDYTTIKIRADKSSKQEHRLLFQGFPKCLQCFIPIIEEGEDSIKETDPAPTGRFLAAVKAKTTAPAPTRTAVTAAAVVPTWVAKKSDTEAIPLLQCEKIETEYALICQLLNRENNQGRNGVY